VDVYRPRTLDEAMGIRAEHPEAQPIQGGTDVMVELTFGDERPPALLDLSELTELRGVAEDGDGLRLGAALTYTEAMRAPVARRLPASRRRPAPSVPPDP
jgi:CO/xanthine dehydrogenase FAD-binding subunit